MGRLLAIFMALFVAGMSFNATLVSATIVKSMHINWGGQRASIFGDNLNLVQVEIGEICCFNFLCNYFLIR